MCVQLLNIKVNWLINSSLSSNSDRVISKTFLKNVTYWLFLLNTHTIKEILFPEAAIGIKIDVDTIDGPIEKLKIPEGTQNGDILRIRGKGMHGLYGRGHGDLYVEIHIKTPKTLSRQARKLLEELKDELK